ncbi:MAG TPA: helix-turn-helix domain-containing protein [Cytophagaceae bacterium]|jgi:DNA-binding transcriptional regulator YiaG|nr:helix-turn-helix domain-containing protein [Cytophagaceae bacterium]
MSNKKIESPKETQRVFLIGKKDLPSRDVTKVPGYCAEKQIVTDFYNRQLELTKEKFGTARGYSNPKYLKGAEAIKIIRMKLNVTQKAFGKLICVSDASISTWETGHNRPPRISLLGIKYMLPDELADLIKLEDFGYPTTGYKI